MEIQRKIVESKNPPSNREVWWFDTNTEVLKRYTGNTWVQAVDSADSKYKGPSTVIETTYEEVRELYNSGKMDPNVKYQFDYKYYDLYNDLRAYFKDLIIYLDGSTVKAEYTGVGPGLDGEYTEIDNTKVYDKSFTADFIFDSIATSGWMSIPEGDTFLDGFYEEIRSKYVINLTSDYYIGTNQSEEVSQLLKDNAIPHKVISDNNNLYVEFYNVAIIYYEEQNYHKIIYGNYYITPNDVTLFDIYTISDYTVLAAIVNVKYDDGTFHKIFIDKYSSDGSRFTTNMEALKHISFYNGDLDTVIEHNYELEEIGSLACGISFTDINKFIYELYNVANIREIALGDYLAIEFYTNVYWLECVNLTD